MTSVQCPRYVNYKKSNFHVEAGIGNIGRNVPDEKNCFVNQVVRATILFPKKFCCPPFVTATALQDSLLPDAKDVFAVTIVSVNKRDFTVNVRRVDTNDSSTVAKEALYTWGQNLNVSWIAVGNQPCSNDDDENSTK